MAISPGSALICLALSLTTSERMAFDAASPMLPLRTELIAATGAPTRLATFCTPTPKAALPMLPLENSCTASPGTLTPVAISMAEPIMDDTIIPTMELGW
jgi:hypothetical protein